MSNSRVFPHVAIRASAGSGKTYQLTSRYLGLLLGGERPEQILATTFTRKAAAEILERVLIRLANAVLDPSARNQLGKDVGLVNATSTLVNGTFMATVASLHRVRISTIDSFFAGIAKCFSFELDLPVQWEIVDESSAQAMRLEAIGATLRGDKDAVLTLIRLISKGRFTRSVASLAQRTVDEAYGIFLSAPESAWQDSRQHPKPDREKVETIVERLEKLRVSQKLPKRMVTALGVDIKNAREKNWNVMLGKGLVAKVLDGSCAYYKQPIPTGVVDALEDLLEQVRLVMIDMLSGRGLAMQRLLATFDKHLVQSKQQQSGLCFDDVTRALATASLLGRLEEVFFRLDGSIRHVLLDEFQDTSLTQWQVLRPLAKEVVATGTSDRSALLVGDVKQAIYGWRGGVADIFDALDSDLPGLTWERLNKSRRSAPPIIETVNAVFRGIGSNQALRNDQEAAQAWQDGFPMHDTVKTHLEGYVCLATSPEGSEEEQDDDRFCYAARIVEQWVQKCPGATIGVLTRSNDAVRQVMAELRELRVAASEEGGNPITDSAAVGIVLSLLTLVDHPGNSIARYHVATSPLAEHLRLRNSATSAARVAEQVRIQLQQRGYAECVRSWALWLAPHCDGRETRRLSQLVQLAIRHDANPSLRADDFVAFASSEKVEDPATAKVRVMTIHKAKGLQFDIVILPELDKRLVGQSPTLLVDSPNPLLPPTRVMPYPNKATQLLLPELSELVEQWRKKEARESLNLLYVALTRAVHALIMVIEPSSKPECAPTSAGVLRYALAPDSDAPPGVTLFESGNPDWYEHHTFADSAAADGRKLIGQLRLRTAQVRSRGLQRESPTGLSQSATVQLADILRYDSRSLQTGSIIHALFEQVKWIEEGIPSDDELRRVAHVSGVGGDGASAMVREFRAMLENPKVRGALLRASYEGDGLSLEVHRELPFALRDGTRLVSGVMDRVVVRKTDGIVQDVDVLDYKSDKVDEQSVLERAEHYRRQLEVYVWAVTRLFGVEARQVRARFLFLRGGMTVTV